MRSPRDWSADPWARQRRSFRSCRPGLEQLPDLFPRTRVAIQGMEFTQSTQHYGTGYDADNAVPLVALKPLVVRVYPFAQPGLLSPDALTGQRITGELVLTHGQQGDLPDRTDARRRRAARPGERTGPHAVGRGSDHSRRRRAAASRRSSGCSTTTRR